MKKLFFILLFLPFICFSQNEIVNQNWNDSAYELSEVISNLKYSKQELYVLSNNWIAKNYNYIISMESEKEGRIIANCTFPIVNDKFVYGHGYIHFVATIDVKDNKCRIILNQFYHQGNTLAGHEVPSGGALANVISENKWYNKKRWNTIKNYAYNRAVDIINDYLNFIKTSSINNNKPSDNW